MSTNGERVLRKLDVELYCGRYEGYQYIDLVIKKGILEVHSVGFDDEETHILRSACSPILRKEIDKRWIDLVLTETRGNYLGHCTLRLCATSRNRTNVRIELDKDNNEEVVISIRCPGSKWTPIAHRMCIDGFTSFLGPRIRVGNKPLYLRATINEK